jgi:anti-sigma factor RsiW
MSCSAYRDREYLLEDYAGGALTAEAAAEVRAHLAACAECRAGVQAARFSAQMLRASLEPTARPSGAFWTRLNARLREEEEKLQQGADFLPALEWLARRLALGAGMAVLAMGGFVVGSELAPSQRPVMEEQAEVREMVPRPQPPASDHNDVLVSLAANAGGK